MLHICSLSSGSSGNSLIIYNEKSSFLIDCGLSGRKIENFLKSIGRDINKIGAVLITHEHGDHTLGAGIIGRRFGIPVVLREKVYESIKHKLKNVDYQIIEKKYLLDDIQVDFFSIPHDSIDCSGLIVSYNNKKIGIITDIGYTTKLVLNKLKNVDVLIIESNYDDFLILNSNRPLSHVQRVKSRHGHLSNKSACKLVESLNNPNLKNILLYHISNEHNTYDLALEAMRTAVKNFKSIPNIYLAYRDRPSEIITIY